MKRTRRIVLGLVWILVALPGMAAVDPVERLEKLAATDLFPEVRAAAAIGLATLWVDDDISNEALQQLAETGASPQLREAAAQALAARLVTPALELEQLKTLAASSPFAAVRQRAAVALAQVLLSAGQTLEALQQLAVSGETLELRQAAVPALAQALLTSALDNAALLALANDGDSEALRQAASQATLARLAPELPADSAGLAPLVEGVSYQIGRVVGADSAPLRQAAAQGLLGFFQDRATSIEQLEAIAADPQNSAELRQAAASVLQQRLLGAKRSLEQLEQQAGSGATPQVQAAAVDALEQALVIAVGRGQLTLQQLVDLISPADSDALNQARANAAFTLLRPNLVFVTDQPLLEAVIRGERATIGGVLIDGKDEFLQRAATGFLAGLFLQFGAVNRFEHPLEELLAMASDLSVAPGFRIAAGQALVKFLSAQRDKALQLIDEMEQKLDRIVIQGRRGQTDEALALLEEVRQLLEENTALINTTSEAAGELGAAQRIITIKDLLAEFPEAIRTRDTQDLRDVNTAVTGQLSQIKVSLDPAPDTSDETLQSLAVDGATPEVRQAASTVLSQRLQTALAQGETSAEILLNLAESGATVELQNASTPALSAALHASTLDDDALLELVIQGRSQAAQQAAANAWLARQEPDASRFIALANGSGVDFGLLGFQAQSQELMAALAGLLQARWVDENVGTQFLLDQAQTHPNALIQQAAGALLGERFVAEGRAQQELIALCVGAESATVRLAASQALTQLLIAQQLPESALFGLISQYTLAADNPLSSPQLAQALVDALADRFLNPLNPVPPPGQPLQFGDKG